MTKERMVRLAGGKEPAELVLKNAQVVNVFTEEVMTADVAVEDGYIVGVGSYSGRKEIDLTGKLLCPGFMDGHMHFETSLVTPREYERGALPHGTTAVMADPHEIANVAGAAGIDYMLTLAEGLTMHAYFTLPSCVPSSPLEETGHQLEAENLRPYYGNPHVLGLAEVMNAVGVVTHDPKVLRKIEDAEEAGKNVDGHAPGLSGRPLCAYVAAGVRTDHECSTAVEAMEKLRLGQWIMIREGTAAKNMEALLPLCEAPYYQHCMFCTDDRHPEDLLHDGHMDAVIRKAVAHGVPMARAVKMCTYHTALCFGLKGYGAVAPGYHADLAVLSPELQVEQVYVGGRLAAENGTMYVSSEKSISDCDAVRNTFHLAPVTAEQFRIPELKKNCRILRLIPHELTTVEDIEPVTEVQRKANGVDTSRDILKMAVLERHHNTGHIGMGFLRGYGLKRGAVATSVAHDAHNLIVVGANDEDMALAGERARALGGALVAAADGKILGELPLPIGGIMSDLPIEEADRILAQLKEQAYMLGVSREIDPFMTLSFASLSVIPKLRLNGRGLIDVEKNRIVEITFD